MTRKYRVGIIGFAHMHINEVAKSYTAHPQVEWVACADTKPRHAVPRSAPYTRQWNLDNCVRAFAIPRVYEDYREMLEKETFDLMIVSSENACHAEVVSACAAHGIHVCVEKPMAASLQDALHMQQAVQQAQVSMAVNWPMTWRVAIRKTAELIQEGLIGRVLEVKWRGAHNGPLGAGVSHRGVDAAESALDDSEKAKSWWHRPEMGGGALLDLCGYGVMLSQWLLNEPALSVMASKMNLNSTWGAAEDNAVMLVRHPTAITISQASWTTLAQGFNCPIVYGTKGTLISVYDPKVHSKGHVRFENGVESRIIEAQPIENGRHDIANEYIHHLTTGEPLHFTLTPEFNVKLMETLDAAIRSANSGKTEIVARSEETN